MRARNIKPGFFKNDLLGELKPLARLLFIGLWCMADKEGYVVYRPKQIKAEILPYDSINIEDLLTDLSKNGFIDIFCDKKNGQKCFLSIPNFLIHQSPHRHEKPSEISMMFDKKTISENFTKLHEISFPLLNPDMRNPERGKRNSKDACGEFKNVYLSEEEKEKLKEKIGEDETNKKIESLSQYMASKGKKYKSHYATILQWSKKDGVKTESEWI